LINSKFDVIINLFLLYLNIVKIMKIQAQALLLGATTAIAWGAVNVAPSYAINLIGNLTFPVKSKIQECKHLDPLSGKALRHNSLDRRKSPLKQSSSLSFKCQK
jgi:hypothetical protein